MIVVAVVVVVTIAITGAIVDIVAESVRVLFIIYKCACAYAAQESTRLPMYVCMCVYAYK